MTSNRLIISYQSEDFDSILKLIENKLEGIEWKIISKLTFIKGLIIKIGDSVEYSKAFGLLQEISEINVRQWIYTHPMSFNTHLSVHFHYNIGDLSLLSTLAAEHLSKLYEKEEYTNAAMWFLLSVIEEEPFVGDHLHWGISNEIFPDAFLEDLGAFWEALYHKNYLCDFTNIMILWEPEQSNSANCIQISWDRKVKQLQIQHFDNLPFCFGQ